jgi:uncharacterized cupredoxin-like copper-binding protein
LHRRRATVVLLAIAAVMAVGCGGGGTSGAGGHDHGAEGSPQDHDGETFSFGAPADPSEADRTIRVEGHDLRFEPERIEVEAGETIAFEFVNEGSLDHEFVLGESADMDDSGAHEHGDTAPNATAIVPPGETQTIGWTFEAAGDFVFECHVDNHDDAGMRGTVLVS